MNEYIVSVRVAVQTCKMDSIEEDVRRLLKGEVVGISEVDTGQDKSNFQPKTKENMGYIVSAVVINEAGQVLMIQEAKYSCHGTWYLPAGRVEKNETLVEAVKREVKEEAGLEMEPVTLISVEFGCGSWMRFNFTGKITGGDLKTLEYQDKESLQAEWIDRKHLKDGSLKIRAKDIFPLIDIGYSYFGMPPRLRPYSSLPSQVPHTHMILRPVIVAVVKEKDLAILTNIRGSCHLPTCYIGPLDSSSRTSIYNVLKAAQIDGKVSGKIQIQGILSVEYNGNSELKFNGTCLSTLVTVNCSSLPKIRNEEYSWHSITSEFKEELLTLIKEERFIKFVDLY